ncbi:hypothetical protein [Archangium lipolyticum]|uniref:hypothetical protein n=1 Tax=Archangium lipolyticum TaxID=2970465 RepID=UPI00214A2612|nr:hypothetical protein [Archangium lipolyticum]
MLSNMPKSVFNGLAALTVAIPIVAWSNLPRVHNVQSRSITMFYESDFAQGQNTNHTVAEGNATFSWQEGTLHSFGNLRATNKGGDTFELKLVRASSADEDEISGEWDVFKNGNPTCAGCKGHLYVSTPDLGDDYLKGYVENGKVGYSFRAELSNRYEY